MAKSNKYLKMIRPWDVIIVLALMLASFIPYVVFARQQAKAQAADQVLTAVVTHDVKEVYHIQLTGHHGVSKFRFKNGNEYNEVVATNEQIEISDADCPDQLCVKKGKIERAGQTIVCLPHKLLVEIKSSKAANTGAGGMVTE